MCGEVRHVTGNTVTWITLDTVTKHSFLQDNESYETNKQQIRQQEDDFRSKREKRTCISVPQKGENNFIESCNENK